MDRKMLTQMICRQFGNYHTGRERLFIILQGSESPRVIMATCERLFLFYLFGRFSLLTNRMMELKVLGERFRMIRKHLGINQQQLADATRLTQPAISRLEKGEEVYASTLLAVLSFYQDKVCLDNLLSPDLDTDQNTQLYSSSQEIRQKISHDLEEIASRLDQTKEQVEALKCNI